MGFGADNLSAAPVSEHSSHKLFLHDLPRINPVEHSLAQRKLHFLVKVRGFSDLRQGERDRERERERVSRLGDVFSW